MIFGTVGKPLLNNTASDTQTQRKTISQYFLEEKEIDQRLNILAAPDVAVGLRPIGVPTLDANVSVYEHKSSGSFVALLGSVFNRAELNATYTAKNGKARNDAETIWQIYEKAELRGFRELNGNFAFAIWDARKQCFYLVRDHLGIEPLYYCRKDGVLYFSSRLQRLTQVPQVGRQLNYGVLQRYLLFN